MASTLLERISQDEKERAIIFEREKILNDYYAGLASARQSGEKEGRNEGRIEGKLEVAAAMKGQGFSIEQICRLTGLSIEEVENL